MRPGTSDKDILWHMIKNIRFAMLTHRHVDGMLHAHPMTTKSKSLDESGLLYFFVSRDTELGERLRADSNVNVSYSDPEKDVYVSLAGRATVSSDAAIKQRLFNALDRAWFPDGWKDPRLELVQVRIAHAEFWNVKESKLTQLLKIATAAATHQQAHVGQHQELHVGEHA